MAGVVGIGALRIGHPFQMLFYIAFEFSCAETSFSILLSIFFKRKSPLKAIFSLKNGWGGRDRTYACRSQSPMPYHLATPQYFKIKASSLYKSRKKVKIFLRFLRFSLFFFA